MPTDGRIDIEVNPTGAVTGSRRVVKSLDDVGNASDRMAKKAKGSKVALAEISRGLIGPLGLASAALGAAKAIKSIINVSTSFEKTISELSAITGATGQDLKFLSDEAKFFGSTTTASAIEVAEAFKLVGSAKPELLESGEALAAVTRQAITLAEASGLTLPESVKALTGSLNQFSVGADQAGRFINVLAAGSKLGATEIPELTESLKVAGTIAAGAGLSFEETVAGIELLGEAGLKGAEAGTQFRNVLLRLNKQGVEELSPTVVGLSQALKNLESTVLSGLTPLERQVKLEKIFGAETIAGASALLVRAQRQEDLAKAVSGTNTAQEQALTNTSNLEGQQKKLDAAFLGVQIAIGENFLPILTQLTADLAVTIRWLNDGVSAAVSFGEAIGDALNTTDSILRRATNSTADVLQAQIKSELDILQALSNPERIAEQSKLIVGLQKLLKEAQAKDAKANALPVVTPPPPTGVPKPDAITKPNKEAATAARDAARAAKEQQDSYQSLIETLQPTQAALNDLNEAEAILQKQRALGLISADEQMVIQGQLNDAFREALDPVGALNERLAQEIELSKLSASQKAIESRVLQEVNALKEAGVDNAEAQADSIRKEVEEIARLTEIQNAQKTTTQEVNKELELQKTILEEIRGPQEAMNDRMLALSSLLARDAITLEEFNAKLKDLRKQTLEGQTGVEAGFERGFIKAQESLNDFASLSERVVTNAFQGMEDGIVNFAQTGKLEFSSLINSIFADLLRLEVRQGAAGVLGATDGKGGGTGILGLAAGLFKPSGGEGGTSGGGGSTGSSLLSGFSKLFTSNAEGGIERTPVISSLAEKGPEAIIPLKGGAVPVELEGGGKSVVNNISVVVKSDNPGTFKNSQGQILNQFAQSLGKVSARNS